MALYMKAPVTSAFFFRRTLSNKKYPAPLALRQGIAGYGKSVNSFFPAGCFVISL
jgi:hypothetical protein